MRSSNPMFSRIEKDAILVDGATATKTGISAKTFLLVAVALLSGFSSVFLPGELLTGVLAFSGIITFIAAMLAMFIPKIAAPMSIVYSIGQGLLYGTITWILEAIFPGIALTALVGTASIFIVMLVLYNTGLLRGSSILRAIVLGSLIAILLGSLAISILLLVNPTFASAFTNNYELSIGITLFMIIIGAFMLTLDFERADQVVNLGLDKKMEWQVALGFMITLIWIYYNILRLAVTILARNQN